MLLLSCSFKKWDDPVLVLFCCRLQQLFYHHPDPAETSSGHFLKHSTTWTISCVKMRQQLEKKNPTCTCFNTNKSSWKSVHAMLCSNTYNAANLINKYNTATVWRDLACTPSTPQNLPVLHVQPFILILCVSVNPCLMS